ncbi:hypothetical protein DL764_010027 [Monosporascus ibericus]|uniref:Uncharacterized protein n=1 Tax=Monosporascus ibericus TaxID=155417 RepID=A0A4Q4SWG6_9PEZI|nr:hypothetical protein DL764_010027 [Monosporascus ibericus]
MDQVLQLASAEYRRARSILYDELLFGAADFVSIKLWKFRDDLDMDDFDGSWLTDARNAALFDGAEYALLRQIRGNAKLRRAFLRDKNRGGSGRPAVTGARVAFRYAVTPDLPPPEGVRRVPIAVPLVEAGRARIKGRDGFGLFSERANFDPEDTAGGEEIEDKLDFVHLAKISNHSFHTFNYVYAGTIMLTLSAS